MERIPKEILIYTKERKCLCSETEKICRVNDLRKVDIMEVRQPVTGGSETTSLELLEVSPAQLLISQYCPSRKGSMLDKTITKHTTEHPVIFHRNTDLQLILQ